MINKVNKMDKWVSSIKNDTVFALVMGIYTVTQVVVGSTLAYLAVYGLLSLLPH